MAYAGCHPHWIKLGAFLKKMPTWWRVYATVLVLAWLGDIAAWVYYVLSK